MLVVGDESKQEQDAEFDVGWHLCCCVEGKRTNCRLGRVLRWQDGRSAHCRFSKSTASFTISILSKSLAVQSLVSDKIVVMNVDLARRRRKISPPQARLGYRKTPAPTPWSAPPSSRTLPPKWTAQGCESSLPATIAIVKLQLAGPPPSLRRPDENPNMSHYTL